MTTFGHSEFLPTIFPKKTGKNSEWPKLAFLNSFKPIMVRNGLESNEICTFLDFKKILYKNKFGQKKLENFPKFQSLEIF